MKKKDKPSKRNRTTAIVVFFVAIALDACGYKSVAVYGFAGLFWIAWLFTQTNWLILETAKAFANAMKSLEERGKE